MLEKRLTDRPQVVGALVLGLLLVQIILAFQVSENHDLTLIISSGASLFAIVGLIILLPLEQWRPSRSSDLGTLYLLLAISLDIILLTAPAENPEYVEFSRVFLVRCIGQLVLLLLDLWSRRPVRKNIDNSKSPEETEGVLSRTFFTWINPILLKGYRNILRNEDMPALDRDSKPGLMRSNLIRAWDKRGSSLKSFYDNLD